MKWLCIALSLLATILLGGCASTYHPISPGTAYYPTSNTTDGITFSYKYDLLRTHGNKKYAKKENLKGIRVVAVKITNNTGRTITYPDDLRLVSGNRDMYVLDPISVYQQLKQGVPVYLLYMLFTPMNLTIYNDKGTTEMPIGRILGPGLTALNMGIAASANSNFKSELMNFNLNNITLQDGETIVGLIGITDNGYAPLSLKLR